MKPVASPYGGYAILNSEGEHVGRLEQKQHNDGTFWTATIQGRPIERFVTSFQALKWIREQE